MSKDDNGRQLSLRDIADEAGVSVSTVSRVLSGSKSNAKISDETRDRILAICEAKKFHPNIHYRRLHEGLSRVIAFIIPTPCPHLMFFDENVGRFLSALEPCLAHHGFYIMIQSATPDFIAARRHLELFRSRCVDAAILWDVFRDSDSSLTELIVEGRPLLKVGFPSEILDDQIVPDNFQGAHDLTQHLIKQGHRTIAHISGGYTRIDKDREAGYLEAIANTGLDPHVFHGNYTYESGHTLTTAILESVDNVTAIMAANDVAAAGCLHRLRELGIEVPLDMSVTGFDGTTHAMVTEPTITTVDLRLDKIGRLAADRIVNAVMDGEKYQPRVTKISMPLLIRESTAAAPLEKIVKKERHERRKSPAKSS